MAENPLNEKGKLSAAQQKLLQQRIRGAAVRRDASAIPQRDPQAPTPLSLPQQSLWFLDRAESNRSLYTISNVLQLRGPLVVAALERALNEIIARHEIFRTRFDRGADGQPIQIIVPHAFTPLTIVDLDSVAPSEREQRAQDLADAEATRAFDMAAGPLLRFQLLRLGTDEHWLVISFHHIIFDGWSEDVLANELAVCYNAYARGESSGLADLPVQYGDFAVWQQAWANSPDYAKQMDYWLGKLANAPEDVQIPVDRQRSASPSMRGDCLSQKLPLETLTQLRALAQGNGATLFMVLLSVFKVLLLRYTGREDLVVGTPVAGRSRVELEKLIGFFVNMLALRTDATGNPTFQEFLGRVRETVTESMMRSTLPFDRLVEELRPARVPGRNQIFQTAFVFQNHSSPSSWHGGLTVTRRPVLTGTSKFDLSLFATEEAEGLNLVVEYSSELFNRSTISRLLGHFGQLVQSVVVNPKCPIGQLGMLPEAEVKALTVEFNPSARPYPRDSSIQEIFEGVARERAQEVALIFGEERVSYGVLNERANRLAHRLRKLGVGPDNPVGICCERSVEMIVALIAILKAGGAYVPLDPEQPKERLTLILGDTQAKVLVTQRWLTDKLPEHSLKTVYLDDQAVLAEESAANPEVNTRADNLAYIIYTSGSTGKPKGTLIPHRGVVRLVRHTDYARFGPDEVFLQFAPLAFDASTFEVWGPLLNGGKLVIMPPGTSMLAEVGAVVSRHKVTTLWLTAGLFNVTVDERLQELKGLRQLLAGGDVLSVPHVKRALKGLPGCRIINGYGPTENTTFTCCHTITESDTEQGSIPIGRPIANTRVYILDRWLQPVPLGVAGELYIGGDGLARGYLNQPGLTEEKFVEDPFVKEVGSRLYKTGDICRWREDGVIEFFGRRDNQVKIRGFRIELGEIEAELCRHAAVGEAVVVTHDDGPTGKRLVAYLTAKNGVIPAGEQLRAHLRKTLPDYMIPFAFVSLESLPLNANGKVNRAALPAPAGDVSEETTDRPRTPIEEVLAAIWVELLGLERVGIHDNFFAIGGHSLLMVQILDRLEKAGLGVTLDQILRYQTIAELADVVTGKQTVNSTSDDWSSLVTLQPRGDRPPLFLIHTAPGDVLGYMKLVHCLGNDQPCYGFQSLGLKRKEACHSRMEDMAAHYVKLLREFQPEGPYYLGGWCFGGNVAMEMARQLVAQGQRVAFLGLIETWAHKPQRGNLRYYLHRLGFFKRIGLARTMRHCARVVGWIFGRALPAVAPADVFAFDATKSGPLKNREHVYSVNLKATRQYRSSMDVYQGRATLFFRENYEIGMVTPEWGFKPFVKEIETRMVPGDHRSVLKEPHVRKLAAEVKSCLERAQAEAQSQPLATTTNETGSTNSYAEARS